MTDAVFSSGSLFVDQFLAGISLLHVLIGYNVSIAPKTNPTPELLVQILNSIAEDRYDPARYFTLGTDGQGHLITEPPRIDPGMHYLLVSLNALTPLGRAASTPTGGIAFEDPVWAILASYSVRKTGAKRLLLPKAKSNPDLWHELPTVQAEVRRGTLNLSDWLGAAEGFVPSGSPPQFQLIIVTGDQLIALRSRGVQALRVATPPRLFELFHSP